MLLACPVASEEVRSGWWGEHLGTHVARRADRGCGLTLVAPNQPIVSHLGVHSRVEHHVGRLDVTVEQLKLVQMCKSQGDLVGKASLHLFRQ